MFVFCFGGEAPGLGCFVWDYRTSHAHVVTTKHPTTPNTGGRCRLLPAGAAPPDEYDEHEHHQGGGGWEWEGRGRTDAADDDGYVWEWGGWGLGGGRGGAGAAGHIAAPSGFLGWAPAAAAGVMQG